MVEVLDEPNVAVVVGDAEDSNGVVEVAVVEDAVPKKVKALDPDIEEATNFDE